MQNGRGVSSLYIFTWINNINSEDFSGSSIGLIHQYIWKWLGIACIHTTKKCSVNLKSILLYKYQTFHFKGFGGRMVYDLLKENLFTNLWVIRENSKNSVPVLQRFRCVLSFYTICSLCELKYLNYQKPTVLSTWQTFHLLYRFFWSQEWYRMC